MTTTPGQAEKAAALRALHVPGTPLVLVNVWDAASARAVAATPGCLALATASHAISEMLGHADGQGTPRDEMLQAVGRVCGSVDLPVTADLEAGYGDAAATAAGAVSHGAAGLNLEDVDYPAGGKSLVSIEDHAAAVAAVRATGVDAGVELVINARTDVFLRAVGKEPDRVALAAERGNAYLAAGADCIFVPGAGDPATVAALVAAIDGPVSVIARPGGMTLAQFAAAGVARVSTGPFPHKAAMAGLSALATDAYADGDLSRLG